jgi:hypothetical protein
MKVAWRCGRVGIAISLLFAAWDTQSQQDVRYSVDSGTVIITGGCSRGVVNIPDSINGLPVVDIADRAFTGCPFTSVTIPNTVTRIGQSAFARSGLTL